MPVSLIPTLFRSLVYTVIPILLVLGCEKVSKDPEMLRGYPLDTTTPGQISLNAGTPFPPILTGGSGGRVILVWHEDLGKVRQLRAAELRENHWVDLAKPIEIGHTGSVVAAEYLNNTLHVIYLKRMENRDHTRRPFYTTLEGNQWKPPQPAYKGPASTYQLRLATDSSGTIHMIWTAAIEHNGAVLYRTIKNGAFGPVQEIAIPGNQATYWQPSLIISENRLHLANEKLKKTGSEIQYRTKPLQGGEWSPPVSVSNGFTYALKPRFVASAKGQHQIVWLEGTRSESMIISRFENGKWQTRQQLQPRERKPSGLSVAIDGKNRAHLGWFEEDPDQSTRLYMLSGGEQGWAEPISLTSPDERGYGLTVQADGKRLILVWVGGLKSGEPGLYWKSFPLID